MPVVIHVHTLMDLGWRRTLHTASYHPLTVCLYLHWCVLSLILPLTPLILYPSPLPHSLFICHFPPYHLSIFCAGDLTLQRLMQEQCFTEVAPSAQTCPHFLPPTFAYFFLFSFFFNLFANQISITRITARKFLLNHKK